MEGRRRTESWRLPAAVAVAGCSFTSHAGHAPGDARGDAGADSGSAIDAAAAPDAAGCGGMVWLADFSSDPTSYDHNGDGVNDFALRDGAAFPAGELSGGVWTTATGPSLDTAPAQPFTTRTLVHVRMRSTQVPAGSNDTSGTLFAVNVDLMASSYVTVFVDVQLLAGGGSQSVSLITAKAGAGHALLDTTTVPASDFVDVALDIDPATLGVIATGPIAGSYTLQTTDLAPPMGSASVGGPASELDLFRVEVCP